MVTAVEAGMVARTDEEQLAFAIRERFVLYTANVDDFARLHAQLLKLGGSHPGIVVRTWQRTAIGVQIRALVTLDANHSPDELRDRLLYLGEFME